MNKTIILATTNAQKLEQMKVALKPLSHKYRFETLKDIHYQKPIKENKNTFAGNSLLKARQVCKDTGFITIAEDSGLCIDALNGAPGIHTHRFAGINASRKQQLLKILNKLKKVKHPYRTAYFVSVITCYWPNGRHIQTIGKLHGKLSTKIVNINNGLTHDPIFIPNGYEITMSKLTLKQKLKISHRGIAINKLVQKIKPYLI